jgi:hypothetical protein
MGVAPILAFISRVKEKELACWCKKTNVRADGLGKSESCTICANDNKLHVKGVALFQKPIKLPRPSAIISKRRVLIDS